MTAIPYRRHRSLTQDVVNALSDRIERAEYRAGEKLPTESALMDEFGVSRTVVREAISHLQAAGLVETRHGIGSFLLDSPHETAARIRIADVKTMLDVMAILELRISLEVEAASLAAMRRTDDDVRQLREILDRFSKEILGQSEDAVAADLAFHLQIASATGNRYFHDILKQLGRSVIPRARVDSAALADADRASYLNRVHQEHESICEAIIRRDPDAARAAMLMHLSNSRERLRKAREACQPEA